MLVPPELADEENKILETLKAGGRIEHFETVRVTKAGKRINVSLTISPIKDSNGRIVGCSGIARDITERKMAEERLREYERAVEGSGEMIAVVDREYRYLIANNQFLKMRNMTRKQVVGRFAHEVLNNGFFESVVKPKLDECFRGKVVRYETKYAYPELGERDISVSYFPIEGANGIDRVACILQDITDRKQAEQALADMTRKLIAAQEQERARIGRELHDDINQRLAMLTFELEQLKENPSEVESRVQELRKATIDMSHDVQALSHDLHSSQLEYLGPVAGMRSWCKQFAERQRMQIDCRHDVRSTLPPEIGLCLFRVLQEALHNAVKHSGVKRIEVQLHEESGEIDLIVSDSGIGFDVEAGKKGKGLGLTSMQERVRLLNGTIAIESKPMGGTTIRVRVPLATEHGSQRPAV
jgi:PAS domain S-box-containing protein